MHTPTQMDLLHRQERLSTLHQEAQRHHWTSPQAPAHKSLWTLWRLLSHQITARL